MMFVNSMQKIWSQLMDDESKFVFEKKLMYSVTNDNRYLKELAERVLPEETFIRLQNLVSKIKKVESRLIVRGGGRVYQILKYICPDLEFAYLCCQNADGQNTSVDGKAVISPQKLYSDYQDYYVLIASSDFYEEIYQELTENGFDKEHIISFPQEYEALCTELKKIQYFDKGIMHPGSEEIFVDGGSYDGDTYRLFAQWCEHSYKKIYAFEADKLNYQMCLEKQTLHPLPHVEIINAGLWDKKEILGFSANSGDGSHIIGTKSASLMEKFTDTIETVTIDGSVGDEAVTFIKLDIEGAELKALEGAKNTIRRCKPKLAICVYHKPEDIVVILEYILSLVPEYKLYLRHYDMYYYDTILYAVL